ncbi:hypothetical protein ABPG72_005458 [Tetrahymena utriculariae]
MIAFATLAHVNILNLSKSNLEVSTQKNSCDMQITLTLTDQKIDFIENVEEIQLQRQNSITLDLVLRNCITSIKIQSSNNIEIDEIKVQDLIQNNIFIKLESLNLTIDKIILSSSFFEIITLTTQSIQINNILVNSGQSSLQFSQFILDADVQNLVIGNVLQENSYSDIIFFIHQVQNIYIDNIELNINSILSFGQYDIVNRFNFIQVDNLIIKKIKLSSNYQLIKEGIFKFDYHKNVIYDNLGGYDSRFFIDINERNQNNKLIKIEQNQFHNMITLSNGGCLYFIKSADVIVNKSIFQNCTNKKFGGAISFFDIFTVNITNIQFFNNTALFGAGIFFQDFYHVFYENIEFENNNSTYFDKNIYFYLETFQIKQVYQYITNYYEKEYKLIEYHKTSKMTLIPGSTYIFILELVFKKNSKLINQIKQSNNEFQKNGQAQQDDIYRHTKC